MAKINFDMVSIPEGSFMMGSDDEYSQADEAPYHEVSVKEFFMSKFPVTQAQWRLIANEMPMIKIELNPEPSYFKGDEDFYDADELPVESITWLEAVEFCDRLSSRVGIRYRLPSEAEWEYACKAGTTTPFSFGDRITGNLANYCPSTIASSGIYRGRTSPVGIFDANAFGMFDMHGNVAEWCLDHYRGDYKKAPKDGSPRRGRNKNENRVHRGGSWNSPANCCRSAYRDNEEPFVSNKFIGFRVVCELH